MIYFLFRYTFNVILLVHACCTHVFSFFAKAVGTSTVNGPKDPKEMYLTLPFRNVDFAFSGYLYFPPWFSHARSVSSSLTRFNIIKTAATMAEVSWAEVINVMAAGHGMTIITSLTRCSRQYSHLQGTHPCAAWQSIRLSYTCHYTGRVRSLCAPTLHPPLERISEGPCEPWGVHAIRDIYLQRIWYSHGILKWSCKSCTARECQLAWLLGSPSF